jgi:hypothetical protein
VGGYKVLTIVPLTHTAASKYKRNAVFRNENVSLRFKTTEGSHVSKPLVIKIHIMSNSGLFYIHPAPLILLACDFLTTRIH